MIKAIVYTSNTGTTKQYAKLLSNETNLPVFSLAEAKKNLQKNEEIIYMGWLMAGNVKDYKAAASLYKPVAVCAVGMEKTKTSIGVNRKENNVPLSIPFFNLQGGFDITKLTGIYKLMMKIMIKSISKILLKKQNRTQEDDDILNMMLHGGNHVSNENLKYVLDWYNKNK